MNQPYDVVIIGGGASGTSLLYTLARYSTIERVLLLEKYDKPGQVNSRASNNSQTLHVGDIETNYTLEKVRQVRPAALMLVRYAEMQPEAVRNALLFTMPKMVLGVGEHEVSVLEKRFTDISSLFPDLQKIDREAIALIEPAVVAGRDLSVPICALATLKGYAVDYERLAQSFVAEALRVRSSYAVSYDSEVVTIVRDGDGYVIQVKGRAPVRARAVVVDADSYSLYFAKQLGYGKQFSLIPIAGSFYFSKKILNGKVYTVQEPLLPFAAVHGDPDVCVPNVTRWGPTARFFPVLESRNLKTMIDYVRSSGLGRARTWISFFTILLEPIRFKYLLTNMLYELPWVGKRMLVKNVQKIIPEMCACDLTKAKGYGGMRLQRVDTTTHELQLGEGKIVGENIIFNMTPSPGASVCLYNAMRDAEHVVAFLGETVQFDKVRMQNDFGTVA
ncbi:MAG: FAD-dependent oxidoreductase [bacterium]